MLRPSPGQNIGAGLPMKPKLGKSQAQINSPEKRYTMLDKKLVSKQSSFKGAKLAQLLEVKSSSLMFDMELESSGQSQGGRAKSFDMREQQQQQQQQQQQHDEQSSNYGAFNCSIQQDQDEYIGGSTRVQLEGKGGYFEILVKPQTELEILIYQQMKVFSPLCKNASGIFDLNKLCDLLNKVGYFVRVEETLLAGKPKLDATSVPHKFLICTGHAQRPETPKTEIVLDPCFRSQFNIVNSTNSYQDLLRGVPQIFVGSKERLAKVVRKLSDEMKESFRDKGLPLPPWRSPRAMLAKWFSNEEIQELIKKLEAKKQEQKNAQITNPTTTTKQYFDVFQNQEVKKVIKFQPIEGFNNVMVSKITLGNNNINNVNNNINNSINNGGTESTVHGNNNFKRIIANEEILKQTKEKTPLENQQKSGKFSAKNSTASLEYFVPKDASLLSQAVKKQSKDLGK